MNELKATVRNILGKKVKTLRQEGFLPSVLYGEGVPSQSIAVPYRDFEKVYKKAGESTLITLYINHSFYNVLIHDIFYDPLKGVPLHADFYAVRMDKMIRTMVPIEFFGESQAVKNEGGILIKVTQELEVEALPKDLPHSLRADISILSFLESKLLVKNIILPQDVKIFAGLGEIVAIVETPRSEEDLAALEKSPEETAAEVKTEQEIKKELKEKEKQDVTAVE